MKHRWLRLPIKGWVLEANGTIQSGQDSHPFFWLRKKDALMWAGEEYVKEDNCRVIPVVIAERP